MSFVLFGGVEIKIKKPSLWNRLRFWCKHQKRQGVYVAEEYQRLLAWWDTAHRGDTILLSRLFLERLRIRNGRPVLTGGWGGRFLYDKGRWVTPEEYDALNGSGGAVDFAQEVLVEAMKS